ncbi:hypothetical protein [Lutispora sp.]|uniref:hypothetical protein n=1 Tax=Lutispora sp. TaxID=2828727 RepID=UPI002B1FB1CD|nr:hypothetical protein [Lutispora sp.]MEA4961461.1 hypothetical protein [Lutispora sp.]
MILWKVYRYAVRNAISHSERIRQFLAVLEMHELESSECKLKELGNFIKNL